MLDLQDEDLAQIRQDLAGPGFSFLKTRVPETAGTQVKRFIDDFPEAQSEINYGGTEKRIWSAQTHDAQLRSFSAFADDLLSRLFSARAQTKTVLAYRNYPVPQEPGLTLGRWHLDSLKNQYKVFCFLTRTTPDSGPLELVPGTQNAGFKALPLLTGQLIAPGDVGTGKRRYQSLDEAWVERQIRRRGGTRPLLCEPGTIAVVDTSAIHRARPCRQDERYALCVYYDHF